MSDIKKLKAQCKGIFHLQMTPFDADENLDLDALRLGIRHTCNSSKGKPLCFLAGGTTAEFYALSDDEFLKYAETFVNEVNGEHPVFVGVGKGSTKASIDLAKKAKAMGADGILAVHPYYMSATEENIIQYYQDLSDAADIPIMLYNNPTTTKMWLNVGMLEKLSKIPNVIADKENVASAQTYFRITKAINPDDMVVYTGMGYELYQYLAPLSPEGLCAGYASELVNFVPEIAFGIYEAGQKGDYEALKKYADQLEPYRIFYDKVASKRKVPYSVGPLVAGTGLTTYQACIKEIMNIMGIPCGKSRKPTGNLTPEEIKELEEVVRVMNCH